MEPKKPTAYVYVDAFNLYYGSLKRTPFKWLDLEKLFDRLLPSFDVKKVYYFCADLKPKFRPDDPGAPGRQKAYFSALEALPRVIMVKGGFAMNPMDAPIRISGQRRLTLGLKKKLARVTAAVWKIEEKGSDVSLGSYLTRDAVLSRADFYLMVTRDSDLAGTLEMLRLEFDSQIGICFPGENRSNKLFKAGPVVEMYISTGALASSQLPQVAKTVRSSITKPEAW
jgi:hypothetical protein